jgi:hypothetical protein
MINLDLSAVYLLTYLLTYSLAPRPSKHAASFTTDAHSSLFPAPCLHIFNSSSRKSFSASFTDLCLGLPSTFRPTFKHSLSHSNCNPQTPHQLSHATGSGFYVMPFIINRSLMQQGVLVCSGMNQWRALVDMVMNSGVP